MYSWRYDSLGLDLCIVIIEMPLDKLRKKAALCYSMSYEENNVQKFESLVD